MSLCWVSFVMLNVVAPMPRLPVFYDNKWSGQYSLAYFTALTIDMIYIIKIFSFHQKLFNFFSSTDIQPHRNTDTQTHRHTGTQAHRHTGAQVHRRTGTQAHRHTGTQAHRRTGTQTHTLPSIYKQAKFLCPFLIPFTLLHSFCSLHLLSSK
jgi:hypothetical protein